MNVIEQLYASPEIVAAFEQGKCAALREHKCPRATIVRPVRIVQRARKSHPRSRTLRWGIVSNKKLLNPTFKTEAEAAVFLSENLRPVNPKYSGMIWRESFVADLGRHFL